MNEIVHIPFHGSESGRSAERFVYVIEFTSGTVKVGQASKPSKRLADHANAASVHGHSIARSWTSGPHKNYEANETALIAFCDQRWEAAVGREYFANADFVLIVAFAETLSQERLTADDIERRAASVAAVPSLVTAIEAALEEIDDRAEQGEDCAWYEQFKRSQAWFATEFPGWTPAPVDIGRHAWAALSLKERRSALDLFFTDYFIALREEEMEEQSARVSGALAAEVEAFGAALRVKRGES